jgi:hypothetical protein
MKQVIHYAGTNNLETDLYVIDGSRKGRHLTRDSIAYILRTMRKGGPDVIAEGIPYRIVNVTRANLEGPDQWTAHIRIGGTP